MAEQNNLDREMQNYRKYLQGKTIFCDSDAPETLRYAAFLREQSAAWDITAVLGRPDVEHLDFDALIARADVFVLAPDDGRYQVFLQKVIEARKGFIIVGALNATLYKELTAKLRQPLMVGTNTFALLN